MNSLPKCYDWDEDDIFTRWISDFCPEACFWLFQNTEIFGSLVLGEIPKNLKVRWRRNDWIFIEKRLVKTKPEIKISKPGRKIISRPKNYKTTTQNWNLYLTCMLDISQYSHTGQSSSQQRPEPQCCSSLFPSAPSGGNFSAIIFFIIVLHRPVRAGHQQRRLHRCPRPDKPGEFLPRLGGPMLGA